MLFRSLTSKIPVLVPRLLITENNVLYAVSTAYGEGIFKSIDGGYNWEQINSGIENPKIQDYTIASDGRIYVATTSWVYRSREPINYIKDKSDLKINYIQIFPNPLTNSGAIKYNLKEPGAVEIKLYDVLGNHLQTLFSGYKEAGFGSIDFSVETIDRKSVV